MNKAGKGQLVLTAGILAIFVILGLVAYMAFGPQQAIQGEKETTSGDIIYLGHEATISYATADKFSSSAISGTAYYKVDGNRATTTAYTSSDKKVDVTYWVSNSTYFVTPVTKLIEGTTTVQTTAIANKSVTITGYDEVASNAIDGLTNASGAANVNSKISFKFLGNAKYATAPFGGLLVVETNNTFTSITCSGDGIVGPNSKYHVTYTPNFAANKYVMYELAEGWDVSKDGGLTSVINKITCDFVNGATAAGVGSGIYLTIYPADYYISNTDGSIIKDVEQFANGVTTKSRVFSASDRFEWAA